MKTSGLRRAIQNQQISVPEVFMVATTQGRVQRAAYETLHRLLDHHKSTRGLAADDRLDPEEFFPVDTQLLVQLEGWNLDQVTMVGLTLRGEKLAARTIRADKNIMLLSSLTEEVKRYTLAHELGHVLLHNEIPNCNGGNFPRVLSMLAASERRRNIEYSDIEREAEVFARELLMPERAVRRHFYQLFGVHQFRASSALARKLAPGLVNLRAVAEEIAKWSNSTGASLATFFGVSQRAMSSRLIGLYLMY